MNALVARRRYLLGFDARTPVHDTDVLILGGGIAGLRAAIEAAVQCDVTVVAKAAASVSATGRAQGGVAAAIGPGDSPRRHADNTLDVGCGLCDPYVVQLVAREAPRHIHELVLWGARFDRDDEALELGREAGHDRNRIVHARGDATGSEIARVLLARAAACPRLRLIENCFAVDLLTHDGRVTGALLLDENARPQCIRARVVVLATGGAGRVYRDTTNPPIATGDGLAMALRAGAPLRDMEMVQFHPTALVVDDHAEMLISEAVRGEGAYLCDRSGRRFLPEMDRRAELAPRDIVSRAIATQIHGGRAACAYLDVRHLPPGRFRRRFPGIDRSLRDCRIDPERDLIPVRPAAHYMIGGVATDSRGRTDLPGLLACGEVASTGLHGANRLASNSLLEGLVFGQRAGAAAVDECLADVMPRAERLEARAAESDPPTLDTRWVAARLGSLMWSCVGIERRGTDLSRALECIDGWLARLVAAPLRTPGECEAYNLLSVAWCIAAAARLRCESRGVHYRMDHPASDERWRAHTVLRRCGDEIAFQRAPLPDDQAESREEPVP